MNSMVICHSYVNIYQMVKQGPMDLAVASSEVAVGYDWGVSFQEVAMDHF